MGSDMIETHDLFLRALAVPVEKKIPEKKHKRITTSDEPKWPDYILAFDTETRLT